MAILTIFVTCFAFSCFGNAAPPLAILISPFTPAATVLSIRALDTIPLLVIEVTTKSFDIPSTSIEIILDLLNSALLSFVCRSNWPSEVVWVNGNEYEVGGAIRVGLRDEDELRELRKVTEWLGSTRIAVFVSEGFGHAQAVSQIFDGIDVTIVPLSRDMTTFRLDALIRKQIKPLGFTSFLFLTPAATAAALLSAFETSKMTESYFSILMSFEAAQYRFSLSSNSPEIAFTGPLFLSNSACSQAPTNTQSLICHVKVALNQQPGQLSLMSIANGTAIFIGNITEAGVIEATAIQIPVRIHPSAAIPILQISINDGDENPSGHSEPMVKVAYLGASLAVMDVNQYNNILPFFDLRLTSLALGLDEFNWTWVQGRIEAAGRSGLGVGMVTGAFSGIAMGVYQVLNSLNYSLPQIGAANTSPALTSPKDFPYYTRVAMSDAYISVIYGQVMKNFGWKNVCILHANNSWGEGLHMLIMNEVKKLNIAVRNREAYHKIPDKLDSDSKAFYSVFREVIQTKVRILILLAYGEVLQESLAALYDLGMRKGDIVLLATEWLEPTLFHLADAVLQAKISELAEGAIQFFPASFDNSIGASIHQRYMETYAVEPSHFACYYYDAILLISYALDYLITRGQDYQSASVLTKAIRGERFAGCTGVVSIEQGTNDRSPMKYSILNARKNKEGGIDIEQVGSYNPSGLVLFQFSRPILWPGNTIQTPTDERINAQGCPFEEKHIVDYVPSAIVSYTVIAGVSLLLIIITLVIWTKCWNSGAKKLQKRVTASFEDYFIFISVAIEAVQYISLGPNLYSWAFPIQWSGRMLIADTRSFSIVLYSGYWALLDLVFVIVGAWAALLVFTKSRTSRPCKCICDIVDTLSINVLPLLGNLCFIPIVSNLLSVFQCTQSVSEVGVEMTVQRAFLEWDCYEFCWKSPHIIYGIVSLLCLAVYVPSVVYLRPAWQHLYPALHVHTSPSFLMVKSVYQVVIIGLEKTVKRASPLAHCISFFFVTSLFTISMLRIRPYGYSRANLWHLLSLISVLYSTILNAVYSQIPLGADAIWFALLLCGLIAIGVAGAVYQAKKLKVLLHAQEGKPVADLFRFMFSKGRLRTNYVNNLESTEHFRAVQRVPRTSIAILFLRI